MESEHIYLVASRIHLLQTCLEAENFHCTIKEGHELHCWDCHKWWKEHKENADVERS